MSKPTAFLVKNLGPSELTRRLVEAASGRDVVVAALDPLAPRGGWPRAGVLAAAELWGYAGPVVSTCPETCSALSRLCVATAAHYCWGPDWLVPGFAPPLPYTARSPLHAAAAAAAWGRPPARVARLPADLLAD